MVLVSGDFSVGNMIGPQTFQARDVPGYIPASNTFLAMQVAAAGAVAVLLWYYILAHRRKDKVIPLDMAAMVEH